MKIGILSPPVDQLEEYQMHILHEAEKIPGVEITHLYFDGRSGSKDPNSYRKKFERLISKNTFGKLFYQAQLLVEKRFFTKSQDVVHPAAFSIDFNKYKTKLLYPVRKGMIDLFSSEDAELIKRDGIDLLIRWEFNIIRGKEFLMAPTYGIWSLHHGDNDKYRGGPYCFWEILFKDQTIGVTLQQLTSELDGGKIIDKAYFNTDWSLYRAQNSVLLNSAEIVVKNIKLLMDDGVIFKDSPVYDGLLYKIPDFYNILIYMTRFYSIILTKLVRRVFWRIFGIRFNVWSLLYGEGDIASKPLFRQSIEVTPPRGCFYADPFLAVQNNRKYIFFEKYYYGLEKGSICVGELTNKGLKDINEIFNDKYHYSYPFIFQDRDKIFLSPEMSEKQRMEVYCSEDFPLRWKLFTVLFEGEKILDPTFYCDKNDDLWLFVNKEKYPGMGSSNLYIYQVENLKKGKLIAHKRNPVIMDARYARNGGRIYEKDGCIIRPSQSNINGVYGAGLNLMQITKLTLDEFEQVLIQTIKPRFKTGLNGLHHLDQIESCFVMDFAHKKII